MQTNANLCYIRIHHCQVLGTMDSINLSSTTLGFNNLGFNKLWLNNPHIQQCLDWTIYVLTTLTFNKIVESECCWIRGLLNPSIFKPKFVESKDCEIQDWWIQWLLNHRLLITRVVESKDCWIKGYLNVRFYVKVNVINMSLWIPRFFKIQLYWIHASPLKEGGCLKDQYLLRVVVTWSCIGLLRKGCLIKTLS